MRRLLATFLFLAAISPAFSQSPASKISGQVTDSETSPLSGVTVSLVRAKDSGLVKLAVTDRNGQYEFVNIKDGRYRLLISSVGFSRQFSEILELAGSDIALNPIVLSQASKNLGNVVVEAKKPFVETKLDRTIVNVDASPTSAGATALDILEKSPGIMVNNDGVISLRGKQGVIIMVDGKQTYLSPADLANLLRNMPASALDQVEIMTNPSSKYDASGNSGVINIKTKKGRAPGLNGSIMAGATTSIYSMDGNLYFMPKSQNSINFNYRKNKVNFFGNYNPNYFRGRNKMHFEGKFLGNNENITGYNTNDTRFEFGNANHTLKLGLDWYADKKNILGVVVSGFSFKGHPTPNTIAELFDENHQLQSRLVSNTDNNIRFRNFTANLNWK
ncbi:MAG TPA: carboxypeptidase regulatory-like domain-containing protein, partial [Flavisolibacter sp.]